MSMVKRPVPAEIPTSSMADIAFLLIVFFMMTTVFSANKGMDHVLPPSKEGAEPDPAVFLKIFPGDSFEIDGTELFLKAGETLDFESNPSLDVTVEVNDATLAQHVVIAKTELEKIREQVQNVE